MKEEETSTASDENSGRSDIPIVVERSAVTSHHIDVATGRLPYTATAGTATLADDGKPKASVFYIAYTLDGTDGDADRPVMFAFNGGPGSAAMWFNLGLLGPRRVLIGDDLVAPVPPYRTEANPYSMLEICDLVFIDPVSTGFSRPLQGEDPKQFHGVSEDVKWVAEFIRLWTTRNRRWTSPKFLIGSSYGTTRAAGLSGALQDRHGIYLNGIVLLSAVLNFQTIGFHPGNDVLPYVVFLPSYAATAWYHGCLDQSEATLAELTHEAEMFALGDYAHALNQGRRLSERDRRLLAKKIGQYTGLSSDFIDQCDLRISSRRFTKELLRSRRRTVGRQDSRFTGIDSDAAGEVSEYDPTHAVIMGIYSASMNHMLRADLAFESDDLYEGLEGPVSPWNYGDAATNRYLEMGSTLRVSMSKNPRLHVMVAGGYFDLATPYFGAEYSIDHLGLDPSLEANITTTRYEAGHMMYVHEPSLAKLRQDLGAFVEKSLGDKPPSNRQRTTEA